MPSPTARAAAGKLTLHPSSRHSRPSALPPPSPPLSTPPAAPLCARHDRAGICKYDGAVLGGGPRQGVCIHTGVTPRIH